MTTLEKEKTGCKACDPELQIKDLKGSIEGLQLAFGMSVLIIVLLSIGTFAINQGRDFWKEEATRYRTKYFDSLRLSTKPLKESSTAWQDSVDLVKAKKQIHTLELQLLYEGNKVQIFHAEREVDVAKFDYLILKAKTGK